jgi:hypothetical protein
MKHEEYAQMWKGFHDRGRKGRKPLYSLQELCREINFNCKAMNGKIRKPDAPKPACYVHSKGAMRPRYDRDIFMAWWKKLLEEENENNE